MTDFTTNQVASQRALDNPANYNLYNTADFSENPVSSTAVIPLFDIPAGHRVETIRAIVSTAEGGTATIDVGVTGADTDGFGDGIDINTTTDRVTASGEGYASGYWLASAYTVAIIANNNLDAAVVKFVANVTNLNTVE